jgi:hypothetical protein
VLVNDRHKGGVSKRTSRVRKNLPKFAKRSARRCKEDPDGDTSDAYENHRWDNDQLCPSDADEATIQKQHVELQCPNEADVGIPSDHEPLGPFLAQCRLLRRERQTLVHGQVRSITCTAYNMRSYCHPSVTSLIASVRAPYMLVEQLAHAKKIM